MADVRSVVIERELPVPPEKVWRALTDPRSLEDWLMKNDFKPVVDRRFCFRAEWGSVDCKVRAIEANRTLSYTWDAMGLRSVVTWTLASERAGTRLRLEQSGFQPNQDREYHGAKLGWQRFLDGLERRLKREGSGA